MIDKINGILYFEYGQVTTEGPVEINRPAPVLTAQECRIILEIRHRLSFGPTEEDIREAARLFGKIE